MYRVVLGTLKKEKKRIQTQFLKNESELKLKKIQASLLDSNPSMKVSEVH